LATERIDIHRITPLSVAERRPLRTRRVGDAEFDLALERLLDEPEKPVLAPDVPRPLPARGPVRLSKHAQARLESRGLELDEAGQEKIQRAVDELDRRGGKESLVLFGDRAYIVGVPQRTVITVFDRAEALGTVFTNIDSTYVDL
jgi:flagellar operon protein